jgi:hypothetical protein
LQLDLHRDLDDYASENSDTGATGALVTPRRCGAIIWIVFMEP